MSSSRPLSSALEGCLSDVLCCNVKSAADLFPSTGGELLCQHVQYCFAMLSLRIGKPIKIWMDQWLNFYSWHPVGCFVAVLGDHYTWCTYKSLPRLGGFSDALAQLTVSGGQKSQKRDTLAEHFTKVIMRGESWINDWRNSSQMYIFASSWDKTYQVITVFREGLQVWVIVLQLGGGQLLLFLKGGRQSVREGQRQKAVGKDI